MVNFTTGPCGGDDDGPRVDPALPRARRWRRGRPLFWRSPGKFLQNAHGLRKLRPGAAAAPGLSDRKGLERMSLRDPSRASGVSTGGFPARPGSRTTLLKMIVTAVTVAVRRSLSSARRLAADSAQRTDACLSAVIASGVAPGTLRPDTSRLFPARITRLPQGRCVQGSMCPCAISMQACPDAVQRIVLISCDPALPRPSGSIRAAPAATGGAAKHAHAFRAEGGPASSGTSILLSSGSDAH
jgi:hypothetical protein